MRLTPKAHEMREMREMRFHPGHVAVAETPYLQLGEMPASGIGVGGYLSVAIVCDQIPDFTGSARLK